MRTACCSNIHEPVAQQIIDTQSQCQRRNKSNFADTIFSFFLLPALFLPPRAEEKSDSLHITGVLLLACCLVGRDLWCN